MANGIKLFRDVFTKSGVRFKEWRMPNGTRAVSANNLFDSKYYTAVRKPLPNGGERVISRCVPVNSYGKPCYTADGDITTVTEVTNSKLGGRFQLNKKPYNGVKNAQVVDKSTFIYSNVGEGYFYTLKRQSVYTPIGSRHTKNVEAKDCPAYFKQFKDPDGNSLKTVYYNNNGIRTRIEYPDERVVYCNEKGLPVSCGYRQAHGSELMDESFLA